MNVETKFIEKAVNNLLNKRTYSIVINVHPLATESLATMWFVWRDYLLSKYFFCLGWGVKSSKKYTVPNLCQSDRHFLVFSDTTRNERRRKSN